MHQYQGKISKAGILSALASMPVVSCVNSRSVKVAANVKSPLPRLMSENVGSAAIDSALSGAVGWGTGGAANAVVSMLENLKNKKDLLKAPVLPNEIFKINPASPLSELDQRKAFNELQSARLQELKHFNETHAARSTATANRVASRGKSWRTKGAIGGIVSPLLLYTLLARVQDWKRTKRPSRIT